MIAWLLVGCQDPTVLDAWSSEGTWHVAGAPVQALLTDVTVDVTDGAGAPATGLSVTVALAMPGMTHATGDEVLDEVAPGTYTGRAFLDMPGLYAVDGALTDDLGTETFRLVVDAR